MRSTKRVGGVSSERSRYYVLLPKNIETDYFTFLGVFAPALIAGSASNVPGGIGVFEATLLVSLKDIPPAALLGGRRY